MGSLLVEPILEYEAVDASLNSIREYDKIFYGIYPIKNTIVWPFKYKRVNLNVRSMYLPDYHVGMIDAFDDGKFNISCKILDKRENQYSVLVKSRGLLPKKIKTEIPLIKMVVIQAIQCHVWQQNN